MERDEKGRFAKGNTMGKRFKPSSTDGQQTVTARKGGIASAEAKRERKAVAEIVAEYMAMPSVREGKTRMDDFVEKAIHGSYSDDMDLRDLKLLQDILGEDTKNLNIRQDDTSETMAEMLKRYFHDNG